MHVGVFDTAFLSPVSIPGQITILHFVQIGMSSVIEACIPVSRASGAGGAYDLPCAVSAAEASVSLWIGRLAEGDPAAAEIGRAYV